MKTIDKRRQKRMDKKDEEKELIGMWQKKLRLMNAKRSLNKVELPKPVRKGYKRFFVLRDDIAKSKEASFFREILKHVQDVQFARDKKFEYKDYKTKKMLPMNHEIKPIEHKEWNKLNFSDKQKSFFEQRWKVNHDYMGRPRGGRYVFEFTKPWMFVHRIEPNYITHVLVIDPQLESELSEIHNRIDRNNLGPKVAKAMGWKWGWRDWQDTKNRLIERIHDERQANDIVEHYDE